MPKNQFQRPAPVLRDHKVPRHGAPIPAPKMGARKIASTKPVPATLPPLGALLGKTQQ